MKLTYEVNSGAFEAQMKGKLREASEATLNNLAFGARKGVIRELQSVFRSPEAITLNSCLVRKVQPGAVISEQFAEVYIRDDVPGASTQPVKYLLTEEAGGERAAKRSERVLQTAGLLRGSQQATPGPGLQLDSHGQPTGAAFSQLLSRIKAYSEMGFSANATAQTTARLRSAAGSAAAKRARNAGLSKAEIKQARQEGSSRALITKSGTDIFAAKSRFGEGFMGIFRLVGKGKITPLLWFTERRPKYKPRFLFQEVVAKNVSENAARAWASAMQYIGRS